MLQSAMILNVFLLLTFIKFAATDKICPNGYFLAPYLIESAPENPLSSILTLNSSDSSNVTSEVLLNDTRYLIGQDVDANAEPSYCYPQELLQTAKLEKRWFWFYLGMALLKTWDNYLKFDGIVNNCKHFTGSWKNGASCVTDIVTTGVAYAGAVKHTYSTIRTIHQWFNNNGFHVSFLKRSDEELEALSILGNILGESGMNLHSYQYEYHHVKNLSVYLEDIHGYKVEDMLKNNNSFVQHNGTHLAIPVLHVSSKYDSSHHVKIRLHDLNPTGIHMDLGHFDSGLVKRDGRYEDEYFTDGDGVSSYFCINAGESDPGNTSKTADWLELREDIKCHQSDDTKHSGMYVQLYDKNAEGTICSGSLAPYTPSKKGVINHMTRCPGGVVHQCGDV